MFPLAIILYLYVSIWVLEHNRSNIVPLTTVAELCKLYCHNILHLYLNVSMQHWTKLGIIGNKPPTRCYHAVCCIAGPLTGQQHPIVMVVGGWDDDQKVLGDVWLLDVDKRLWTEVNTLHTLLMPYI